jgi:hypothetical protein
VSGKEHRYLDDPVHREEGGTPAIIESIRAGLVFQLKEAVGADLIRMHEEDFVRRAIHRWSENADIRVLGNKDSWRLSIVSFMLRHRGSYLHHNFVVALLNDLFGIQARGGCSCAGPYGHRLLGIDADTSHDFQCVILGGYEGIKPGWVRINFNYFISEAAFEFLVAAVDWVARHGWKLLPHYRFEPTTGQWRHRGRRPEPRLRLHDVTYRSGRMEYRAQHSTEPEDVLSEYLAQADAVLERARLDAGSLTVEPDPVFPPHVGRLKWFVLPGEALAELRGSALPDLPMDTPIHV